MSTRRYARRDEVSATELAEMGFCEKRVQLAHLYGDQATPEQRKAMARGQVAHPRYLEEWTAPGPVDAPRLSLEDRWCSWN